MSESILKLHGARFLDPANVGSSIRWGVEVDLYTSDKTGEQHVSMDAAMNLTDCSRVINWSAYSSDQLLTKVQAAIAELRLAEKALKKASALMQQYGTGS